ncbi:MAG: hypothetical protein VKJ06_02100 [Vampirovibrionales bacterium]|nr:hypothetical protein [Vampirovibrionales bacterium]
MRLQEQTKAFFTKPRQIKPPVEYPTWRLDKWVQRWESPYSQIQTKAKQVYQEASQKIRAKTIPEEQRQLRKQTVGELKTLYRQANRISNRVDLRTGLWLNLLFTLPVVTCIATKQPFKKFIPILGASVAVSKCRIRKQSELDKEWANTLDCINQEIKNLPGPTRRYNA